MSTKTRFGSLTAYAVLYTNPMSGDTDHTLLFTEDEAAELGATVARDHWDEFAQGEPFPEDLDDWEAMDALRTGHEVHLEVEEIVIPVDVVRRLYASLCERCHDEPITDSDSGLGPACSANNDGRVVL